VIWCEELGKYGGVFIGGNGRTNESNGIYKNEACVAR